MQSDLADYADYINFLESLDDDVFDKTLIRLCKKHPDHKVFSAVHAKLLLIDRGMTTGIERQIKSSNEQGSSMWQLAEHLQKNHNKVDQVVKRLRSHREPLDLEKLEKIVAAHGDFCNLVAKITRGINQPASFASKYLHFHAPIVPVYDSWANWQACKMLRKEKYESFEPPPKAHSGYHWYCVCFWQVYSDLRDLFAGVSVRLAEGYLGWRAGQEVT